jgi:elongation factor 2
MRGMRVVLLDAELHEDPAHRTFAQVFPAIRRAILGAILTSDPTLYEPMMKIVVQVTSEYIGAVSGVISSKRGSITSVDQKEYFAIITGEIPLAETFDISKVMRSATGGKAFWNLAFERWSILSKGLLTPAIQDIRQRKGLSEHLPSANDFRPL